MNKYKIGKYIVKADSIRDAVTIVKTIKNSIKDGKYQLRYNNGAAADMNYFKLVKETPTQLVFKNLLYTHKDEQFIYVDKKTKVAAYNSGEKIGTMTDAVEKTGDSVKDGKYVSELKPGDVITKKDGSKWDVVLVRHTPFGIQVQMNSKTSPVKTEEITYRPTDMLAYDSCKDARRINYDDDIIEVTLNGKVVFRGYAEDWLDNNFDSNFKWTGSQYEASNAKGKWVVRVIDSFRDSTGSDIVSEVKMAYPGVEVSQIAQNRSIKGGNYRRTELTFDFKKIPDKFESANRMFSYIERKYSDEAQVFKKSDKTYVVIIFENLKKDSFQKDSLTVRDVIQSLINEETSAISSYNVALETLKDHIPDEAYEAIKAIRDDEQRHVENLYAVLNGNVTPKNLEN